MNMDNQKEANREFIQHKRGEQEWSIQEKWLIFRIKQLLSVKSKYMIDGEMRKN